jgi:glutamyl-tRNA reductase
MNLHMVGCSHHDSGVDTRELLAFNDSQAARAMRNWRQEKPETELVLVSTCNRVELYTGGEQTQAAPPDDLIDWLLSCHQVPRNQVQNELVTRTDCDVVDHLFRVAASLDSMVVGEPQILSQIKEAYSRAQLHRTAGPVMHDLFQSALRTARRIARATQLHSHHVSIPSVAIADFASRVFERFDDKRILVIGAGEMAEETLRYLCDAGANQIDVINRDEARGDRLATRWNGKRHPWESLSDQLVVADLVVSTTASTEPIINAIRFESAVAPRRHQRPLFILDLAVPRDFDPRIGLCQEVYLYSLDDLTLACEKNRVARQKELPAAEQIILQETERFQADAHHRATAPVITGLRQVVEGPKEAELDRLFNKLPELDETARQEIVQFADRLINKMLHPPMQSLREASKKGTPHGLLEALRRLFQLQD